MDRNIVEEVGKTLRLSRRRRMAIARELRSHLEESRRDLELAGWHPDRAASESVSRLGNPEEIAAGFEYVYRPSRRAQLGLALTLATGLILGVYGVDGTFASATSSHHRAVTHHMPRSTHRVRHTGHTGGRR